MSTPLPRQPAPVDTANTATLSPGFGGEAAINISRVAPRLLNTLFLHHDGIVLGATLAALSQVGVLEYILKNQTVKIRQVLQRYPGNAGYLNVALRCLALQGWLHRRVRPETRDIELELTPLGRTASLALPRYVETGRFVFSGIAIDRLLFTPVHENTRQNQHFKALVEQCLDNWRLPAAVRSHPELHAVIQQHLDGMLLGPLMIALKRLGLLEGEGISLADIGGNLANLELALDLLRHQQWIDCDETKGLFTGMGKVACGFTLHYGLTLSYWPMLCRLPQLIANTQQGQITHATLGQEESHVDRTLNVLASGVAHRRYFEDSDEIIKQIFNQEPLADQPRFVADMGCGDGAWLQRIYEVVRDHTLRGRYLEAYPLLMVGADFNVKAVEVVTTRLGAAQVPHITLFGDITDPDRFAKDLQLHGLDIRDGLHIRAFIDHNRRYTTPADLKQARQRKPLSSGAYTNEQGEIIPNQFLEQNLVEHFRRWVPYVEKHGLIVIEAHNVRPEIAARYSGRIHATAFDTYHGFSNQYPVDFDAFMDLAEEAGLRSVIYQQKTYPTRLPFIAISLNRFKSVDEACLRRLVQGHTKRSDAWQPDKHQDYTDGEALDRFLYRGGDHTRPARWCFASTGDLLAKVFMETQHRLAILLASNEKNRNITLLDYGAGTGLVSLEMIKGLDEKGILKRCQEHGIRLRLFLLDLPSSWFAQAYRLLHEIPYVEFFSLRDPATGRIRQASDFLDPASIDIVIASMVFHLIPPKTFALVAKSLAEVLKPNGLLVWNTPDTAPAPPFAELIHVGNRALRQAISELLDGSWTIAEFLKPQSSADCEDYADLPRLIDDLRHFLSVTDRSVAKALGQNQILAEPTPIEQITQNLTPFFEGETSTAISPLSEEDLIELALLPANQRYFSEIPDPETRARLTKFIIKFKILPELHTRESSRFDGINLHWTAGMFRKHRHPD